MMYSQENRDRAKEIKDIVELMKENSVAITDQSVFYVAKIVYGYTDSDVLMNGLAPLLGAMVSANKVSESEEKEDE